MVTGMHRLIILLVAIALAASACTEEDPAPADGSSAPTDEGGASAEAAAAPEPPGDPGDPADGAETDEAMLFDHCLTCAHEPGLSIRKAIGWALREYAKTAPKAVGRFRTRAPGSSVAPERP